MKFFSLPKNRVFLFWILLATLTQACSTSKHLNEGETILEKNSVRIKSDHKIKNAGLLKEDLDVLYVQEETRFIAGLPAHYFYYLTRNNPDSTWLKTWIARKWAAPPVIFDSTKAIQTTDVMKQYLGTRGYRRAEVDFKHTIDRNRSRVLYTADPKTRWHIDTILFESEDEAIQELLLENRDQSYLKKGAPVDIDLYDQEKLRITRLLQNRGYAEFSQGYISNLKADTTGSKMNLTLEVRTPYDAVRHDTFHIGKITVLPESLDPSTTRDTLVNGVIFRIDTNGFIVKPDIILKNIFLREGDLYRRLNFDRTYQQLSRIEAFKFVSINSTRDSLDDNIINYEILLTRNKKMGLDGIIELNYSTISFTQRSLMGSSANLSYLNRNLFGGAEVFNSSIEGGIEINLRNPDTLINSVNLNFQNSLIVPKFIDPFGLYGMVSGMNKDYKPLLGNKFRDQLIQSVSKLSAGYNFVNLIDFYNYQSVELRFGYEMRPDYNRKITITHLGFDLFSPEFRPAFQEILDRNIFLRESFNKQLFSGLLFKDYSFEYRSPVRRRGFRYQLFYTAEISGLEVFLVNTAYNAASEREAGFSLGTENPLAFSHFAKVEFDNRWYQALGAGQELAFRFATGLAATYGPFTQQVPYIKQFYLGGPLSIRAWQIRELGPGGYNDPNVNPNSNLPFYQTGDFKLEANIEYRADLFWIFEGALFVDAGNVWTLRRDPDRPGAQISSKFIDQIAIGAGVGLRMDFEFFRIRLDFGYKIRSPYPIDGEHWLFDNFKDFSLRQVNTNFAIGYPF